MADEEPSYIDYEAFLSPDFSAISFANTLVTSTNDVNDSPLDLSTPLSRVLFDLQEIDTHIHTLTTRSALPLLTHTRVQTSAALQILTEVEDQVSSLIGGYQRLEKEVLRKWESADQVRIASEKSWTTVRLARAFGRCITLSRQLQGQLAELNGKGAGKDDHRAMVRASNTLLLLRQLFSTTREGEEGNGLDRMKISRTLKNDLIVPAENTLKARAQQVVNKFSIPSLSTDITGTAGSNGMQPSLSVSSLFAQTEDTKARTTSAVITLYLLSPTPRSAILASQFQPELLLSTLQGFIHNSLAASLAALTRALAMLPTLERTLLEVSGRCQDIAALEAFLVTVKPPTHPLLVYPTEIGQQTGSRITELQPTPDNPVGDNSQGNLLQPLLQALDTSSLPSYYWRSLASSLPSRVQEIISRGGVSARTLRSNRERLRSDLRDCVLRGSRPPANVTKKTVQADSTPVIEGNWEREAAVIVGSVMGVLGK
jgi:Golgi transport complex subunit 5